MEFWDVMGFWKSCLRYINGLLLLLPQHFLIKLLQIWNLMEARKFTYSTQMVCNENCQNYIEILTVFWDLENLAYVTRMFWNGFYNFFLN